MNNDQIKKVLYSYKYMGLSYTIRKIFGRDCSEVLYDYLKNLDEKDYPQAVVKLYRMKTGKDINLDKPITFNEKIQWLKIYDTTTLKTRLTDKLLVRDWIKGKIGEQYLIPLLGTWRCFDDICFNELPKSFVLKTTHSSGWNLVVTNSEEFNQVKAKKNFDRWMNKNFTFYSGLELQYLNIEPHIIAEKYIGEIEEELLDYRFFCFNGEPLKIWVDAGSGTKKHKRNIYDMDWKLQKEKVSYPNLDIKLNVPKKKNEMVKIARILSEGFTFVRVDLYYVNENIYFGEMTFTPQNGTGVWDPESANLEYGKLIKI